MVLFFIWSKSACIWIFHWVVFSAWLLTSVKMGDKKQRRISFFSECVRVVLWSLHVYVILDQTWPDDRCRADRSQTPKNLTGVVSETELFFAFGFSDMQAWCYHGVPRGVSVLVFAYIFYHSLPAGVKARGSGWVLGFKNKKLKHIICGCWPRGRRQDRWTNDRCPHGWIEDECSVKKALCVLPEGGNTEPTTDTRNPPSS